MWINLDESFIANGAINDYLWKAFCRWIILIWWHIRRQSYKRCAINNEKKIDKVVAEYIIKDNNISNKTDNNGQGNDNVVVIEKGHYDNKSVT